MLETQITPSQGFSSSYIIYGTQVWGGHLKNPHWIVFEKSMKMHMMSHIKVCPLTTYHILLVEFKEPPT